MEEAAALLLADALWTRGLPDTGAPVTARGFPFHIDVADNVAETNVCTSSISGRMRAVPDQLQVISWRGRKRWMGLVLVPQ
ncbi:hypothetical protein AB0I81_15685 [Nonomuraea sp. NPDC050404]|uniref:hypothetical protein n=1 Tax=Nonomuraea sp. NPDC050404 TaxID=3155783 RepID=UPI0033FA63A6